MKREGEEKEVRAEVCHHAEDESFPDREHEKREVRKLLKMNLVPAGVWPRKAMGMQFRCQRGDGSGWEAACGVAFACSGG